MNFLGEYLAVKKDTFLGSYVGEPSKKLWKGFKNTLGGVKRFLTFEAHEVENAVPIFYQIPISYHTVP